LGSDTWKGGNGSWLTAGNWSAGEPTSTTAVIVDTGDPHITSGITIASLSNSASLSFLGVASSTITGGVTNAGFFDIDDESGVGGTNLDVGGTFTNTGYMQFGDAGNSLAEKTTIKLGALVNLIGEIDLNGGTSSTRSLLVDVTGGPASFGVANEVTGDVSLSGYTTLDFKSGEFTTIASGALLSLDGRHAILADAAKLAYNSALSGLRLVAGTLNLSNGAAIATTGALNNINQLSLSSDDGEEPTSLAIGAGFQNNATTSVDTGGLGGSVMTVNGVVTNNGAFYLGSVELRQTSTVTAKQFVNYGALSLSSGLPTGALALLDISAAAGFGQTGVLQNDVALSGNSEISFASGQINIIASDGELDLFGKTARIADAASSNSNSALTGLKDVEGTLKLAAGSDLTTGPLTVGARGELDVDTLYEFGGIGGSVLTVNGALKNDGQFNLGAYNLTGSSDAVVDSFDNADSGNLVVLGSFVAPERALLTVTTGVAGFGVAGHVIGSVDVEGDASIQFASGQITTINSSSSLALYGPQATIADKASPTANSALEGLAKIAGGLDIDDGVKISTTGGLFNSGSLQVDGSAGGSVLSVKGTLTNDGQMSIGSSDLSATSEVSAAAIDNTGTLALAGGTGATEYAILDVAGPAGFGTAGRLTGYIGLSGRSRIQFSGDGVVTDIASGASLFLDGASAAIANATSSTSNSALTGLAENNGVLDLSDGATVSTSGSLDNTDYIEIDATALPAVSGGSKLAIDGALKNGGTLDIGTLGNSAGDTVTANSLSNSNAISLTGASSKAQAVLDIAGASGFGTAGVLTGDVSESGYADIQFGSGQIDQIASDATLDLDGAHAFVSEGSASGNSALDGLKDVAGDLYLADGSKVTTTAGLTVEGTISLDSGEYGVGGGSGGSELTVGGALVNNGALSIGNSTITQSVAAFAKLLTNNGALNITGGASAAREAELSVAGAAGGATGALSGSISLSGYSALRFASGLITSLVSGASLMLDGAHAIVASGTATVNSALAGLQNIAGALTLDDGANFSTTAAVSVSGQLQIDTGYENVGGTKITIGGALDNSSYDLSIGNDSMTKTSEVIAKSLDNSGQLTLTGGDATTAQALIDITGAAGFGAAGALGGTVNLTGHSAIEFASGEISTIQSDATLSLDGPHAFIETGGTNSNSGLTGLTSNAGYLSISGGVLLGPTGNFANSELLYVDNSGTGGSQFEVGGKLTNAYGISIGNSQDTSAAYVSAASLLNEGYIDLVGGQGANAELAVSGSVVNSDGEFDITSDTEVLKGAVTGSSGFFNLGSGSTLELDGSVSAGQTVAFSGADELKLGDVTAFAAAISSFGAGDKVDIGAFGAGTTHSFSGGVLTLHSGAKVAHLHFSGSVASDFSITSSASGTVIAFH
jgi:hypothetical protein